MTARETIRGRGSAWQAAGDAGARPANWLALALVVLVAAMTFWRFDALPFQDLPGHAGLIAMRHRFAASAFEQRYYKLDDTIGPYSLFLRLGGLFDLALGPLGAARALGTLPVIATPAALLFARRRLHGDRTLAAGFLGVALSFGFMTLMGLASFTLSLAILLIGLTAWLELSFEVDRGRPARLREAIFGALAILTFVAHGFAFALLLALVAMTTMSSGNRLRLALRWRSLAPSLALAAWSAERGGAPAGSLPWREPMPFVHFQGVFDKLSLLVTPTLITRTGIDIALGLGLWVVLLSSFAATARSSFRAPRDPGPPDGRDARSRAHSRALAIAAAGVAVTFFVLPHSIGWFGFVDGRLVLLLSFLFIIGLRREALGPRLKNALDRGAPPMACAMTALAWFASHHFQREAAGYREVFAAIPAESRVLNLPIDPYSDLFTAHPLVHYDKLIEIDRCVLLSDVWPYRGSALYPTPENPATRLPRSYDSADLKTVDWPAYRLEDWDYVLVRTRPDAGAPATPDGLSLLKHVGGWWLFRTRSPARPSSL